MSLVLVTPGISEPISLTEAKAHLRVDDATDNDLINSLIVAAREFVENQTKRALVSQTWDLFLDAFPTVIELPKGKASAITHIKYVDTDGIEQTLNPANYQADTNGEPGRIAPSYGYSWPATRRQYSAVNVRFEVGYQNAAAVPAAIKSAILLMIGHLYENREATVTGTIITKTPAGVDALIAPYTLRGFG